MQNLGIANRYHCRLTVAALIVVGFAAMAHPSGEPQDSPSESKHREKSEGEKETPRETRQPNAREHEKLQWVDFSDRVVEFSGYHWRVKGREPRRYGPRSNWFSDSPENVWVDDKGRLHLKVTHRDGKWLCSEIVCEKALGYGDYVFQLRGRVDRIDRNLVYGLFLWEYQEDYGEIEKKNTPNEFDIEFSSWQGKAPTPAQFVCQPYSREGNLRRVDPRLISDNAASTWAFRWEPKRVLCRAWRGHRRTPTPDELIDTWNYTGPDVPRQGAPRLHINLWLLGEPPSDGKEHEVIVERFRFMPVKPTQSVTPATEP